jgi:tetratricopeptide (TPR) repeat protein
MSSEPQGGSSIRCPGDQLWLELAGGLLPAGGANQWLEHAGQCAECAAKLKQAVRVLADEVPEAEQEMLQSLNSSSVEWQRAVAARAASAQRRPVVHWMPAVAAAAVAILAISGALYWKWRANRPPLQLLAEAYTSQRTFDLRIPGAAYGPMRVERGALPNSERPETLLESEARIARHRAAAGDDAQWLHAEGRADLLDHRFDDAIATLRRAVDLASSEPARDRAALLVDLATAYHERALADSRAIDESAAVDLLGQAIAADSSLAVAFFNRAIVFESLALYQKAIADWNRYLSLDPSGPWAEEARRRLAAAEKKLKAARLGDPNRLAGLAEYEMAEAMQNALPPSAAPLAERLRTKHQDAWLADALAERSPQIALELGGMVRSRQSFAVDRFPTELQALDGIAARGLAPPDRVWLAFERLYRTARSPKVAGCADVTNAIGICRARRYPWFLSHFLLERSNCEMAEGSLAVAEASAKAAAIIAAGHDFPVTRLHALGYLSNRLVSAGNYREAAAIQAESLALFWSRPFPTLRAQQFYSDMMREYEALGRSYAAKSVAEVSAWMAGASGAKVTEAVTRAIWAQLAQTVGDHADFVQQSARSEALFDGLLRNPFSDQYRAFAEAATAETRGDRALLTSFEPVVRTSTNPMVTVPYLRAMALLDERGGDARSGKAHLEEAIARLRTAPAAAIGTDRLFGWRYQLGEAYRALVAAELRMGEPAEALRRWQELLAAEAALEGNRAALPAPSAETGAPARVFRFARLGDRYGVWIWGTGAIDFAWAGDAGLIDRLARRYAALCASPQTSLEAWRDTGRRLREALFDFGLARSAPGDTILVQPDAGLSAISWGSLPLSSGEPLEARYFIAIAPLDLPVGEPIRSPAFLARSALIVGASRIDPASAAEYPALPGLAEELAAVKQAVPGSTVLTGPAATVTNIERGLDGVEMLHFAGHAAVSPNGVDLLVAPDAAARDAASVESGCPGSTRGRGSNWRC